MKGIHLGGEDEAEDRVALKARQGTVSKGLGGGQRDRVPELRERIRSRDLELVARAGDVVKSEIKRWRRGKIDHPEAPGKIVALGQQQAMATSRQLLYVGNAPGSVE